MESSEEKIVAKGHETEGKMLLHTTKWLVRSNSCLERGEDI